MKKLLLFFFFSGSLDSFSQNKLYLWPDGKLSVLNPRPAMTTTDTLPSSILISHKPPSFGHSIDGYCIYQGDHCVGKRLRYWHKRWIVIGPEYTVWGCKRVNTPKK